MLLAQENKLNNLEIYISFLSQILEKDTTDYKRMFSEIAKNVHLIVNEKITYSEVPSETFDIVSFFAFNHGGFFKNVNPGNLTKEDYTSMLTFLKSDLLHRA